MAVNTVIGGNRNVPNYRIKIVTQAEHTKTKAG